MAEDDKRTNLLETVHLSEGEMAQIRHLTRAQDRGSLDSLLIYSHDGIRMIPLNPGQPVVIGRFPPADVAIRDNSLSRQHARLELIRGEVWVQDLQSTNGTRVNGKNIERCTVRPGDELAFGAVTASIQRLDLLGRPTPDAVSHDQFLALLDAEVCRARCFERNLALMMLRGDHLGRWYPKIRGTLRPFETMALYSADTVEILVPEAGVAAARTLASSLQGSHEALRCGFGIYPEHAGSASELVEVTRQALQLATGDQPIQTAARLAPGRVPPGSPCVEEGAIVESAAMKKVYQLVARVAASAIPVLIVGETGTGKELLAHAIHQQGNRAAQPLICVNCGAIPSQLVESTLFGHERGAFTGATEQGRGVFETADGGLVLLDEIGELPMPAQVALLRVLETHRFCRVGSSAEIAVDVRVLAATHQDLEAMCQAKTFRQDLYYRLNGITIQVPPLRARIDDIEPLIRFFVEQSNRTNGRAVRGVEKGALDLLQRYPWPGNVRELRNAIERAVVIASDDVITLDDLPEQVRWLAPGIMPPAIADADRSESAETQLPGEVNLKDEMNQHESKLILNALQQAGWDRQLAAERLGISLRTLSYKMQAHRIRSAYKQDPSD